MTNNLPADLIRHGWNGEIDNHTRELVRALELAEQHITDARRSLANGTVNTHALRQLTVDAVDAFQRGAALAALDRVKFAVPADDSKEA